MPDSQDKGFSLIELLAVVGIFMILGTIAIVSWDAYAPVMTLDSAAQALSDNIQLAMEKAQVERNQWFVLINYTPKYYTTLDNYRFQFSKNTYVIVDDDGWNGGADGKGLRQYNSMTKDTEFAPSYSGDHPETHQRNNNLLERRELFKGPLRLDRGVTFMPSIEDGSQVRRIVFDYIEPLMFWQDQSSSDSTPITVKRTDPARIYLRNPKYRLGDNSSDNLTHRRIVKVMANTVKIIR